MNSPPHAPIDLTICDREPIQSPGSIQPHGVLLVLQEPSLTILQVSANVEALLGLSPNHLVQSPLNTVLNDDSISLLSQLTFESNHHTVHRTLDIQTRAKNNPVNWRGIFHRTQGLVILELEKIDRSDAISIESFTRQLRISMYRLHKIPDLQPFLESVSYELKRLTHFDRVMIYRFNEDETGEVVAESKEIHLQPFLGLNFPASDIPKQARGLYEKNRLRAIPDAQYIASPLIPEKTLILNAPLDLSFSTLRSVSPIHLEYLKNMGVRASMTISLLKGEKLWGLIACHHYECPKFLSYEVRSECEFMAQMIAQQISNKIESENKEFKIAASSCVTQLISKMSNAENFAYSLAQSDNALLALTQASGAVISYEGEIYLAGKTPALEHVRRLLAWLQNKPEDQPIFQTHCLTENYPTAEPFKNEASGILSISISKANQEFLIWFRPEVLKTVHWGGDPSKPAELDPAGTRITPRKSFDLWKENVQLHSKPWLSYQIEAALELRTVILETIIRKAAEIKRLNADLIKAVRSRDDFISVASHELKTPLTTLLLQIQLMLKTALKTAEDIPRDSLIPKLQLVNQQIVRLSLLIENLMDFSRITAGRLRLKVESGVNLTQIITEVTRFYHSEFENAHRELQLDLQPDVIGTWDAMRLGQIVTNLISNGLKYGGKNPVKVALHATEKQATLQVIDHGIGIAEGQVNRIFNRFERAVPEHSYKGLGLGLWITRQIVEALGGKISVKSKLGQGTEFTVEIPRNPTYPDETIH